MTGRGRLVARLATVLVPPGPVRDRYRAELAAELHDVSGPARLARACSVVLGAPALHRALVEAGAVPFPHAPLWCRVRLHHRWRRTTTDDGLCSRRCRDCGTDEDGTSLSGRSDLEGVMMRGPSQ